MIDIKIKSLDLKLFRNELIEYVMNNGKNPKYVIMNKNTAEDIIRIERQNTNSHLQEGRTILFNKTIPVLIHDLLKYGEIDIV